MRNSIIEGKKGIYFSLGPYASRVEKAFDEMRADRIMDRIWNRDFTVWKDDPKEIADRLGWLTVAEAMKAELKTFQSLAESIKAEGFTKTVLLGMGGSSLAPEVLMKIFGAKEGHPELAVVDTTDPDAILSSAEALDPARTLFIVSTKSGGTVETFSLFKFFFRWTADRLGQADAGKHFIAITDGGSRLEEYARRLDFRSIFLNNPEIGGRYSALSYFGLIPATLCGIDPNKLLGRAIEAMRECRTATPEYNPAAALGAAMGELAKAGRDKLTFFIPPPLTAFGDWLEQLIAESTGKKGRGILPVIGEPPGEPQVYAEDRVFVSVRLQGDNPHDGALSALRTAGHPVIEVELEDRWDIGYQFFLWELAVAVSGARLGVNPFDQPNVEAAKALAREMVSEFLGSCTLPAEAAVPVGGELSVVGRVPDAPPEEALRTFLRNAGSGDYAALQAFIAPSEEASEMLRALRVRIRDRYRLATTAGYGPRYLHSTGQLHKGDRGKGLFIRFTADNARNVSVPDEPDAVQASISFGTLKNAQSLGDKKALLNAGRRILHFHLGSDIPGSFQKLLQMI